ncbi:MAG TPA: choice-of-anchor Q domain-containing protein, partial [Polyangiaceae bacterium]|nr:choice-of-anchor Q domain-containing protein [Polyangiaceae bacterium]
DSDVAAYNSVFLRVPCATSQGSKNVQFGVSGTCPSDTLRQDPKLAALANNGGPTLSMMPAADSPALGIGQSCPATDQRGQARSSSGCDSGSVER